jgi:serine/threonine protein kinase
MSYHGAASDIWSCGVILFALLTGRLPFDDENIRVLLQKVKNGRFAMPADLAADAKDLITKMLVVDPEKRITVSADRPWQDRVLTFDLDGGDYETRFFPTTPGYRFR